MATSLGSSRYFGARLKHKKHHPSFVFNILAFLIMVMLFMLVAWGVEQVNAPLTHLKQDPINLDPSSLIEYSLRTALRMFCALILSLIFTLMYATLAAKNKYCEQILVPLLDVLQSVPILGYISFTVTAFLALVPGSIIGAELAAIFAIFTSQVWNMTFSFYQSLNTVPRELSEASVMCGMSGWQKFWRVELPFAVPSLVWNIALSMSGGWFFVVASEVIAVGNQTITLPGIGSYISLATDSKEITAIFYAIIAMMIIILLYDQLLMRPLIVWSEKFRYDMSSSKTYSKSWLLSIFQKSILIKYIVKLLSLLAHVIVYIPLFKPNARAALSEYSTKATKKSVFLQLLDYLWYSLLFIGGGAAGYYLVLYLDSTIGWLEVIHVFKLASITLFRVMVLIVIASIIWIPVGVYIGLNPKLAAFAQPIMQFLAAFPVNLFFPAAVIVITYFNLNPNIWLSPLIIMGTQWFILFNVTAGAAMCPIDLRDVSYNLNIKGWLWWKKVILPAIAPYFITGVITASGGAWNASILAEVVSFGSTKLVATGLGSYIAEMTLKADFHRIVLGVGVMSLFVVTINRFFWHHVLEFVNKKYSLN